MFSNMTVGKTMTVTITGILIVFLALVILIAIISLFGYISKTSAKKKSKPKNLKTAEKSEESKPLSVVPPTLQNADTSDDELAAVIAAASYMGMLEGKNYKVKSVKPASGPQGRPIWATAGILENNRSFK